MKMTSKGTLLLTLAGAISFGCSAPADEDPVPTAAPPFYNQPQPPPQQMMQPVGVGNGAAGASGVAMGAAGASGVAMGAAGSAGVMMGAAGAGGAPVGGGGGTIPVGPPGTGFALVPVAGWVAGGTNEAGIQGSFFPLSDADGTPPGATTITPAENFSMATGPAICVSGSASQVIGEAYGQYWGGGVGFNLADPGGMTGPTPWARGRVVGFSFNITGTTIPPAGQFRFGADFYEGAAINGDSCVNITAGANTIMFSQIVNQCWMGGMMAPPLPATAMLQSLKWQVATTTTAATPFNFCIENLRAIVQ